MADTGDFIPVENFREHVRKLHHNDDYPFSEEYSVSVVDNGDDALNLYIYIYLYIFAEC